ncbi:MAG TPA: OB-fold nucleic acid binding domain-containing protein [Methanofastidiosum sp.]|nr:OB-fold nucleic acid binding domain-containing protein [Methanofastidiosum sp.]HPA48602.1 OB-fold nucleic acid binding domain-containing protein [Methanofastidiosum sp.]HQK62201.1 OB-fold nucleic acid binding domain-containing protein [Methanofastidiosum sp.]HQM94432.1 OB-fold nucleic acid binding domain-containing protein [Methanofastidiosum sp.]HQQ48196.1 OB-fold nucleic acid binding domain-containing protein [Methanofastidiosum sp.]
MKKRMPSSRLSLAEIHKGYFVKPEDDFATNYVITQDGLKVYRLKGVATVMAEPRLSEDGTYGSIFLDDGTQSIVGLVFRENTRLLKSLKKGNLVQFMGKLSEWQGKKQVNLEAISVVSSNMLTLHRAESVLNTIKQRKQFRIAQKIHNEETNVRKAMDRAKKEGINPELIDAIEELNYLAEYAEEGHVFDSESAIESKVLDAIDKLDEGDGVVLDLILYELKNEHLAEDVDNALRELLARGDLYEPKVNYFKKAI